jgi:hypothetical protein
LAVASLVLGILTPLSLVPGVLSVIFGIIALNRISERGQRGKGLAIGGLSATGAWVLIGIALVAVAIATDTDGTDVAGGDVRADQLTVGDCIGELPDGEEVLNVSTVGCEEPHEGQVFAQFDLPDGEWPGEDSVTAQADSGCLERLQADLPAAYEDQDTDIYYLYPTHGSWRLGDREVICAVYYLDGQRTGSLLD